MYCVKVQLGKLKFVININGDKDSSKWNVMRHCNAQYELHIALSGNCVIDVDKDFFALSPGKALLISPGQYHSTREVSDDYEHYVLSFLVNSPLGVAPCTIIELPSFDVLLCEKIVSELKNKNMFWRQRENHMHQMLLCDVLGCLGIEESTSSVDTEKSDKRFSYIDNFFEQNLSKNSTEEHLCRQLNLSRRQLNRVLNVHYQMGFREKMHRARLDRAEYLLRTTDTKISKICEQVGYTSETSFFKAFKGQYGISPGAYRKRYNQ